MTYIKCRSGLPYVYRSIRYDEKVVSYYQMSYRKWLSLGYGRLDVNVYRIPKPCLRNVMKFEAEHGLVKQ